MKKVFLFVGCISLLTVSIASISCKKDKDEWKGCLCTYAYGGSQTYSADEAKIQYGVNNCSELSSKLTYYYSESTTCKNL